MQKTSAHTPVAKAGQTSNIKITQDHPGVNNNSMQSAEKNSKVERKSIDIDSFAKDDKTIKELKFLEEHVDQLLEISGGDRKSVPKTRALRQGDGSLASFFGVYRLPSQS